MINLTRIGRVIALSSACIASQAMADTTQFSYELGLIVGSAKLCGYNLDDNAVSKYVADNVPGSDFGFASDFTMHVGYHRRQAEKLAPLELRIHCESALRSAEYLKLLQMPGN